MNESQKLSGTVVFVKTNIGSKSEATVPCLKIGNDTPLLKILLRNDNPFENKGMVAYDGKFVELTGELAPSGTFIVDEIADTSKESI